MIQGRARLLTLILASLIFLSPAFAADPAKTLRRLGAGDLVRFVEGAGLDLAEILSGPDPSNYYLVTTPNGEPLAVPREKLRLVQSAGTKKAAFNAGDVVERKLQPRGTERGVVVRVNGSFCEVKPEHADSNWYECRELSKVPAKRDTGT
jgi:hypothetical protein